MSEPTKPRFDVLMVTDCRFPGGNSASVAEEIVAQTRAGYRTGLLHLPSTVLTYARPFSPKLRRLMERGDVELVMGVDEVETRLLLARHPTVFSSPPDTMPRIRADEVVLAVNQVPSDERGAKPYYDVAHVSHNLERLFSQPASWAPIGPRVRDALADVTDIVDVSPDDWENIVDVSRWHVEREGFVGDRPVIGRHSRGHWTKWPDTTEDILAAYPDDPEYVVSVLGGMEAPKRLLGRIPDNWVDHPFDSMPAPQFLSTIDFFVYFHHPGLIEAFGRVVLEGLSAGAVSIVPPYLERIFGDVCLYGEPGDVRGYVDALFGDWPAFQERSERGIALARERFSYETHVGRVASLIGPPSADEARPIAAGSSFAGSRRPVALAIDLRPAANDRPSAAELVRGLGEEQVVPVATAGSASAAETVHGELLPRALDTLAADTRRRYLKIRIKELVKLHDPRTVLLIDDAGLAPAIAKKITSDTTEILRIAPEPAPVPLDEPSRRANALAAALPAGWAVGSAAVGPSRPERDALPAPTTTSGATPRVPVALARFVRRVARGVLRRVTKLWRYLQPRLAPLARWLRNRRAQALDAAASQAGLRLVTTDDATAAPLPVPGHLTHPNPEWLPITLVVITVDGDAGVRAIHAVAERQQVTSNFRVVLLVPPGLEVAATAHGFTAETLMTESAWNDVHGEGWSAYLRGRIRTARATFDVSAVALWDTHSDATVMDVIEAAGAPPPAR